MVVAFFSAGRAAGAVFPEFSRFFFEPTKIWEPVRRDWLKARRMVFDACLSSERRRGGN